LSTEELSHVHGGAGAPLAAGIPVRIVEPVPDYVKKLRELIARLRA
jgi:hypothetical protein